MIFPINNRSWECIGGLFEQVRVRARAHKSDDFVRRLAIKAIDQEEIATNVAFAMSRPLAGQNVIQPLRSQRAVIGDEQYHQFLEALQVEASGVRKSLPILAETLRVV